MLFICTTWQITLGGGPDRKFDDGDVFTLGDGDDRKFGDGDDRKFGDGDDRKFGDGDDSLLGDGPDFTLGDGPILGDGPDFTLGDGVTKEEEGVLFTGNVISGAKITFLFIGHDHKVTLCIL